MNAYTTTTTGSAVVISGPGQPALIESGTFDKLTKKFIDGGCTIKAYRDARDTAIRTWDTERGAGFLAYFALTRFLAQYIIFPWTRERPDPATLKPGDTIPAYWPSSTGFVTVHHVTRNGTIYATRYIKRQRGQSAPRRLYDCGTHYSTIDSGPPIDRQ